MTILLPYFGSLEQYTNYFEKACRGHAAANYSVRVINLVGCVFENTSLKSNLDSNLRLFVISVTIIHVVVGRYIVVNNMSQGEARLPLDKKGLGVLIPLLPLFNCQPKCQCKIINHKAFIRKYQCSQC